MIYAVCLIAIMLSLTIIPGKLGRRIRRKGKKYTKRFIKKQLKHEINRFKPF